MNEQIRILLYSLGLYVAVRAVCWLLERRKKQAAETEELEADPPSGSWIKMTAPTVSVCSDGTDWREIQVTGFEFTGTTDQAQEAFEFLLRSVEDKYRQDTDPKLEPFEKWADENLEDTGK